jgi:sigma-E factor negative regulatory protein RseC
MEKFGVVIRSDDEFATLNVGRSASCGDKCATCSSHCEVPTIQVKVKNELSVRPGDTVQIGMSSGQLIGSTFIMYTVPLIFFVIGVVVGVLGLSRFLTIDAELVGILSGFIMMIISYLVIHHFGKKQDDILKMVKKL